VLKKVSFRRAIFEDLVLTIPPGPHPSILAALGDILEAEEIFSRERRGAPNTDTLRTDGITSQPRRRLVRADMSF
jgi:hypothetical protein